MEPVPKMYIHVGLPKAGSTWLQNIVLPKLCCAKNTYGNKVIKRMLAELMDDEQFDLKLAKKSIAEESKDGPLFLSQEGLSFGGVHINGKPRDRMRAVKRLYDLEPNAKIIYVVRRQSDMLKSVYYQYIKRGGCASLSNFVSNNIEGYTFNRLNYEYDVYVEKLQYYFGKSSLLVLPFELLKKNEEEFLDTLCNFIDCQKPTISHKKISNRTPAPLLMRMLSIWNKGFRRSIHNSMPLIAVPKAGVVVPVVKFIDRLTRFTFHGKMNGDIESFCLEYLREFSDSNRALQEYVDYDLSTFGYFL